MTLTAAIAAVGLWLYVLRGSVEQLGAAIDPALVPAAAQVQPVAASAAAIRHDSPPEAELPPPAFEPATEAGAEIVRYDESPEADTELDDPSSPVPTATDFALLLDQGLIDVESVDAASIEEFRRAFRESITR